MARRTVAAPARRTRRRIDQLGAPDAVAAGEGTVVLGRQPGEGEPAPKSSTKSSTSTASTST